VAVALPAQAHALGPQRLELATDAVKVRAMAGQGRIDPGEAAWHRRDHANGAAVLDVRLIGVVPFGIADAGLAFVAVAVAELQDRAAGRRIVRQQHLARRIGRGDHARGRQLREHVAVLVGAGFIVAVDRSLQSERIFGHLVRLVLLDHPYARPAGLVLVLDRIALLRPTLHARAADRFVGVLVRRPARDHVGPGAAGRTQL